MKNKTYKINKSSLITHMLTLHNTKERIYRKNRATLENACAHSYIKFISEKKIPQQRTETSNADKTIEYNVNLIIKFIFTLPCSSTAPN